MKFSLIICTYMRPKALVQLLNSVTLQTLYPNEIIIVDGSTDNKTKEVVNNNYKNLKYFKVAEDQRGLTRQRNFGISKISKDSEFVSFLDDDTILTNNYFETLSCVFKSDKLVTGVGGIAINENKWKLIEDGVNYNKNYFITLDGYYVKLGARHVLRNILGLGSNNLSNIMPEYSNGLSCSYPLNGKIYSVDLLIGMSMAFRKEVINSISFSEFFEGYGLYEDADFSLRALKFGKNVISTNLHLYHLHNQEGRPNRYKYGKMVVRNGWYVWRVKYETPALINRVKWNLIVWLLILIRLGNTITTKKKREALSEATGRIVGWFSLLIKKPTIIR